MMLLAATESMKWERQRLFELLKIPKPEPETQVEADLPPEKSILEQHPYLTQGFAHFKDLVPMVHKEPSPQVTVEDEDPELSEEHPSVKAAMVKWKLDNPGATLKEQRAMFARGDISELPWLALVNNTASESGFGPELPATAHKGDTWVLTSALPNRVYKFNGNKWISVDKTQTDNYTYNEAYLDHLIAKIESGEYDIDLLSINEQDQLTQRLEKKTT
jgi:hypothetical protein